MQQNCLFDLGHQAEPVKKRKKPGSQSGKSRKNKQYQEGYKVTPTNLKSVTGKGEQNQIGYTVTPGYTKINNNHKIKIGDGDQVSLSENSTDAESKNFSHSLSKIWVTRCNLVTYPKSLENPGYTKEKARCNFVTSPKIQEKSDLAADPQKRPLIDRKTDLFLQAIQHLAAVKEDGESLLNTYLPKAKVLLDGGLWWKRASAWTDDPLGKAMKDYFVSEETFIEMLETWKEAILAGCRRMKAAVKKRKV